MIETMRDRISRILDCTFRDFPLNASDADLSAAPRHGSCDIEIGCHGTKIKIIIAFYGNSYLDTSNLF